MNIKTKAFTLSEVLITLVIIGVIAAMTVPSLLQSTQKEEYVSGLKKAHSVLSNALYIMADRNGYPHGDYSFLKDSIDFIDEFSKISNTIKKCNSSVECFGGSLSTRYKFLSGNPASGVVDGKSLITSDGYMYTYKKVSSFYGITNEDIDNGIGRIIVDVNGVKPPNRLGYDTFFFYIIDGKGIVPAGADNSSECNKSDNGRTCAGKVIQEGKISY